MVDMPRSAAGALRGVGGLRAGTTARSDAEQRASDARVRAVVRRIEACDQAGDVLAHRLAAEPQQAGRGTELEEQGLPRGGDRDRPLELLGGTRSPAGSRDISEQTLAPEAMELVLGDAFASLLREGERRVQHLVRTRDVATREMGSREDGLPVRSAGPLSTRGELEECAVQGDAALLGAAFLDVAPAEKHR